MFLLIFRLYTSWRKDNGVWRLNGCVFILSSFHFSLGFQVPLLDATGLHTNQLHQCCPLSPCRGRWRVQVQSMISYFSQIQLFEIFDTSNLCLWDKIGWKGNIDLFIHHCAHLLKVHHHWHHREGWWSWGWEPARFWHHCWRILSGLWGDYYN